MLIKILKSEEFKKLKRFFKFYSKQKLKDLRYQQANK